MMSMMSIGWLYLALILAWFALLGMLWLTLRRWLAEEVGPDLEGDEGGEPRVVTTCRELSELAAKTREASHG